MNSRIESMIQVWEARSLEAHPSDAMLISKHIRELREAIICNPAAPIDTGGPAFPIPSDGVTHGAWEGMTLRDYFAAEAMNTVFAPGGPLNEWPKDSEVKGCAIRCYTIADAMMIARVVKS